MKRSIRSLAVTVLVAAACKMGFAQNQYGNFNTDFDAPQSVLVNWPFNLTVRTVYQLFTTPDYWVNTHFMVTLSRPTDNGYYGMSPAMLPNETASVTATGITQTSMSPYQYMALAESYDGDTTTTYLTLQATTNSAPTGYVGVNSTVQAGQAYTVAWRGHDIDANLDMSYLEVTTDINQAPTTAASFHSTTSDNRYDTTTQYNSFTAPATA
ncbi:MAG TPA: hypothetical protein VFJ90_01315, partial [Candidatus Didemnitutus sp.]|nr:hypothetical protein [Candidatus Didemnitutus sp.]